MSASKTRGGKRIIRHARVRRKISGTTDRPRLSVFRSLNHIYAQVIDDIKGNTMVSGSTLEPEIKKDLKANASKKDIAKLVGGIVGKRATNVGIKSVVFDRGGYKYHGRVKALAEGAREEGLVF
ncbi:MAG: 50S ribosomal protein L18 [Chloroflexota bacterium]|nr:50S ribosomal protein L18 [Chloroflexota bacterium]